MNGKETDWDLEDYYFYLLSISLDEGKLFEIIIVFLSVDMNLKIIIYNVVFKN